MSLPSSNKAELVDIFDRFFQESAEIGDALRIMDEGDWKAKSARENIPYIYSEKPVTIDIELLKGMKSLVSVDNVVLVMPKGRSADSLAVLRTLPRLIKATFFIDYSRKTTADEGRGNLGYTTDPSLNVSLTDILNYYVTTSDENGDYRDLSDMQYAFVFRLPYEISHKSDDRYTYSRVDRGNVFDGDVDLASPENIADVHPIAVASQTKARGRVSFRLARSDFFYSGISQRHTYQRSGRMMTMGVLPPLNYPSSSSLSKYTIVVVPDKIRAFLRKANFPPRDPSQGSSTDNSARFYYEIAEAIAKYGYASLDNLHQVIFVGLANEGIYTKVEPLGGKCSKNSIKYYHYVRIVSPLLDLFKRYMDNAISKNIPGFLMVDGEYYVADRECDLSTRSGTIHPLVTMIYNHCYILTGSRNSITRMGSVGHVFEFGTPRWADGWEAMKIVGGGPHSTLRIDNDYISGSTFYSSDGPMSIRDFDELSEEEADIPMFSGRVITRYFRDDVSNSPYPVSRG